MTGDTDRAVEAAAPPSVNVPNVVGVIGLGYGRAARHLLRLLVPAAVVLAPVNIVLGGLLIGAIGRGGLIVDGELTPLSASPGIAVAAGVALLVWYAAYVVALAATVVISAGDLLGRPVRPGAAFRAAAGKAGALAVMGVLAVLLGVLSFGAGVAVASKTGTLWISIATWVVVLAAGVWILHALPVALLDGRGVWRSLGRAWSLTRHRRPRDVIALMLGLLGGPVLVAYAVRWALSPFGGTHTLLGTVIAGAASLLLVPFQAMTLTAATLNEEYPDAVLGLPVKTRPLDLDSIAARLSDLGTGARLRTRWVVPLAAALVLPGLLYGGYVRLNPLDLPVDHVVASKFGGQSVALDLPGGRPMPIDDTYLTVRACADPGCSADRMYDYSEDAGNPGPVPDGEETGTATLPDGATAVAAWVAVPSRNPAVETHWALRLLRCGTGGCGSPSALQHAPILTRTVGDRPEAATAMTVTRGGILIAVYHPNPIDNDVLPWARLIRCADARCATPRTIRLPRPPDTVIGNDSHPLAVAADRDGRPVIAYEDGLYGGVAVVSCDDLDCRHSRTTWPDPRSRRSAPDDLSLRYLDGVHVEVPPDGRPVVAFEDVRTGAARLLHCRTRVCAKADDTALTGPDSWRSRPALALDRDGRPLVATYDHGGVELIACRDAGCAQRQSTTLAKLKHGPGYLDLALTHDRRPVVLWSDEPADDPDDDGDTYGQLHLTTCARPRCGLP